MSESNVPDCSTAPELVVGDSKSESTFDWENAIGGTARTRRGSARRPATSYLSLRECPGNRGKCFLIVNIHPRDVASLNMESRAMWGLYRAKQFCQGKGDGQSQEGKQVLIFARNTGTKRTPLVTVYSAGWGKWEKVLDKETLERDVFLGPLQTLLVPDVEVDTTQDGTPVLVFHIQAAPGSGDAHKKGSPGRLGYYSLCSRLR